jgi:hypothetical protein
MKFTKVKSFNKIAGKLDDYKFVSFILSSWHLDVLYSYVLSNKLSSGIIIVLPQSDVKDLSRFRLSNENFIVDIANTDVCFIEESDFKFDIINLIKYTSIKRKAESIFVFNPGGVNYLTLSCLPLYNYNINYVQIDEGTSTYLPDGKKGLLIERNTDVSVKINLIRKIKSILKFSTYYYFNALSSITFFNSNLFITVNSKLLINDDIANNLKCYYNLFEDKHVTYELNSILIIKDFDKEVLPDDQIIEMYEKMFQLLQLLNIKVYIKKHPNDLNRNFDTLMKKYAFIELLSSKYSAEAIVSKIKPVIVIGGISTSIFTIPAIYGIKTISFMNLYKEYSGLNNRYLERINILYELFNDFSSSLIVVDNIYELEENIQ